MKPLDACFVVATIVLTSATAMAGQDAATRPKAGVVTGSVTCADTNAPARFAVVTLQPVPATEQDPEKRKLGDAGLYATTDMEGRFYIDKVSPGRYYVVARLTGYVNPLLRFDWKQLQKMSEETRKELSKVVPIIDMEANQTATVALRLEHASEVDGTVLYDDGSPAVDLLVQLLQRDKDGKLKETNIGDDGVMARTDDRGHYRMIGTSAGSYLVRASLPTGSATLMGVYGGSSPSTSLDEGGAPRIYLGDTFRNRDAKVFKVGEGDQVGGLDITIPVAGLHTVRGTVTAKRDGHALNRGQVDLLYADDREPVRSVQVDSEGNFALTYVPEDRYILQLKGAGDGEEVEIHPYPDMTVRQNKAVRNYGDTEMPLIVQADVSGAELAAPEAAAEKVASE